MPPPPAIGTHRWWPLSHLRLLLPQCLALLAPLLSPPRRDLSRSPVRQPSQVLLARLLPLHPLVAPRPQSLSPVVLARLPPRHPLVAPRPQSLSQVLLARLLPLHPLVAPRPQSL